MTTPEPLNRPSVKELMMRYTPAALALSLALCLSSSALFSAPSQVLDPRAAALEALGRVALESGDAQGAVDNFEAALAIQPGAVQIMLDLAQASRKQGLQGKALHYYRVALQRDPQNLAAISGEGEALVEKGAVEKAKRSLARLEGLCGLNCDAAKDLAAAIARGPTQKMVAADDAKPAPAVSQN